MSYLCMAETVNGPPCSKSGHEIAYGIYLCHLHLRPFLGHISREYATDLTDGLKEEVKAAHHELARVEARAFELRLLVARAGRRALPRSVREHVIDRDGRQCTYCDGPGDATTGPDGRSWHIDHVHPVIDGGSDDLANLALACGTCNNQKHAMPLGLFLELLDLARTEAA